MNIFFKNKNPKSGCKYNMIFLPMQIFNKIVINKNGIKMKL